MERGEAQSVQVDLSHHGSKTRVGAQEVCKRIMHAARCEDHRGGHRESARSGYADDGENAEVDSALPRRRYVVRDHGLLLGLGLGLGLRIKGGEN